MNKQILKNKSQETGFSLIEVLVTMLVMAVGLLGIAALQFKGLQYSQDAYIRSQINFLAYDIADRVRLNRANAASYVNASTYTVPTTEPTGCNNNTASSASNDLACWRQQVYAAIPPGSLANIYQTGGTGVYQVQLQWTDKGNLDHSITYSFQP